MVPFTSRAVLGVDSPKLIPTYPFSQCIVIIGLENPFNVESCNVDPTKLNVEKLIELTVSELTLSESIIELVKAPNTLLKLLIDAFDVLKLILLIVLPCI
jgi:hypothetical protein